MAELLIVVAILVVLAGVSFVAVQKHQRSMTQLEYDTIAKEIFIAAQNHLTMAESQGYLGIGTSEYGTASTYTGDSANKVYYITYPDTGSVPKMHELMLPFGSVDETIRAGGSYIIRYQPSSGTVLDVFYSNSHKTSALTVNGIILHENDYAGLMAVRGNKTALQSFTGRNGTGVVGWYGDGSTSGALPIGERLSDPVLTVHNEEKLWVEISYTRQSRTPPDDSLKLIITGKTSNAKTAIQIFESNNSNYKDDRRTIRADVYQIVLDDITTGAVEGHPSLHFNQLPADNGLTFIPGEDLEIEAVAYNNNALTNIAYSGKAVTNSLFSKISNRTGSNYTAEIDCIRHLENLDNIISKVNNSGAPIQINKAEQIANLSWSAFISYFDGSVIVYDSNSPQGNAGSNGFYPISPSYPLTYDGQNHSISEVQVDYIGDAGLFGSTSNVTEISNLELIDFNIKGTTSSTVTTASAGALAGSLTGCTVTNVLARNSAASSTAKITATTNAGGLIGKLTGGTVQYSAAAVIVDGGTTAYAGGLVGTVSGNVNNCYSGGHTLGGSYQSWIDAPHPYDVTGATAGGLIGSSSATINNCYSTCSVSGTSYGAGLLGKVTNGSITNCYATGMIDTAGANNYAFIASGTPTTFSNNYYYMTINEVEVTDSKTGKTTIEPMKPFSAEGEHELSDYFPHTTPLDLNASFYNDFVGGFSAWDSAEAYDNPSLLKYYNGKYPLRTVLQLPVPDTGTKTKSSSDYFVSKHYGDWPAPEIFIINN